MRKLFLAVFISFSAISCKEEKVIKLEKPILVDNRWDYTFSAEKTKKGTLYSLFYSNDEAWTHPNGLIMTLLDDGNGLKISKFRKAGRLDYDESIELSILLRAYYSDKNYTIEMVETKTDLS